MKNHYLPLFFSNGILFFIFLYSLNQSRSWDFSYFVKPLYKLDTNEMVVALTFDDGPSKYKTEKLINILKNNTVHATFFMLGDKIEQYPIIAKRVIKNGNLVGNHSYDHKRLLFQSPQVMNNEIEKKNELIGQDKTHYFRPPYSSKYLLLPYILKKKGMQLVTGTYDPPSEYISPYNEKNVIHDVVTNCKNGTIVYLHDGNNDNVDKFCSAVDGIIKELMLKGYRIVKLDMNE